MKVLRQLILLIVLVIIINLPIVDSSHNSVAWREYKYDPGHTGYYPIKQNISIIDYNISVMFTANLCIASNPILFDVNGDGGLDAIFPSCDGYTYAVNLETGGVLWKVKTGLGLVSPALLEWNDEYIVVVPGPGYLYGIDAYNGSTLWSVRGLFYTTIPVVDYSMCNGGPSIIATTMDGKLYIIKPNGEISKVLKLSNDALNPPALGDVTGDNCPDIVVMSRSGMLYVYSPVNNYIIRMELSGGTLSIPAVYNGSIYAVAGGYLYKIRFNNSLISIWSESVSGDLYTSPSIGDVNGDGVLDVVVPSTDGIYVFRDDDGGLEYFFKGVDASYGGVIIADIDGDGHNEMIVSRYDYKVEIVDLASGGGDYLSSLEYSAEVGGPLMAPPAIGDIDNDGVLEIVQGCRDFNLYVIHGIPMIQQGSHAGVVGPSTSIRVNTSSSSTMIPGWEVFGYLALAVIILLFIVWFKGRASS